ncbi:hypothetical protein EDB87DRAFT_78471 [Lactarius vividus]|nr:hypothetical protein EDB87DRAFT_78471 [Lactarius vividus]
MVRSVRVSDPDTAAIACCAFAVPQLYGHGHGNCYFHIVQCSCASSLSSAFHSGSRGLITIALFVPYTLESCSSINPKTHRPSRRSPRNKDPLNYTCSFSSLAKAKKPLGDRNAGLAAARRHKMGTAVHKVAKNGIISSTIEVRICLWWLPYLKGRSRFYNHTRNTILPQAVPKIAASAHSSSNPCNHLKDQTGCTEAHLLAVRGKQGPVVGSAFVPPLSLGVTTPRNTAQINQLPSFARRSSPVRIQRPLRRL